MHIMRFQPVILALALASLLVGCAQPSARHTESVACGNFMVSIGCAARLWANDRDGYLPSDLLAMTNELINPIILHCPGDHSRPRATNWSGFTLAQSSYELVTPHLRGGDTNGVFLRCKVHGHL